MNPQKLQPRVALNKAFLKINPFRNDIENFKTHLQNLLDKINKSESEEFHKNLIVDFLKNTFYSANNFINTKGRNDLVIHNGKDAKSSVGVILEFKKPNNKGEMLKVDNLNTKAFQELVLYFLRERILEKNLEIKYLIATNIYEWFIFDAQSFEKLFMENKSLVKQFTDFEAGRLTSKKTEFFYKEIAQPAISEIADKITFTHFDIRDYQEYLNPGKHPEEHKLISLFKLFSPEHLLKLPFTNDSNTLDKGFYSELLHIIGLVETKEGSKKLIQRQKEHDRNIGSLIENAISQVDSLDKISRLEKPELFGETYEEQLFNLSLELAITWMNRILFLKLLEAQLIRYHKNDPSWGFLNLQKVNNYDDLNSLFFSVLARKPQERSQNLQKKLQERFAHVPYLNSSLFEPTDIEQETICISNLRNEKLPIFTGTILKDNNGKKLTGEINTLEYLFAFLNAYNFSSDTGEEIQEDNKRLINASVLGLIFEKINGYKDGSFFTPGFITMYMCRETIRRAVIQKFNDVKGWNCETIDNLYDKIEDKKAANDIINGLKICDPAVGSGHFLVSALNEIIAIKSELKILLDRQGKRLKEYSFEVANDELVVTDEDGLLFEYNPKNQESQRVQETLFHEKQTIIESCLFGVDINPNSVKICRLRLWIELLKNAYYKTDSNYTELETLPNIDINIKCGNSLISRFSLDANLQVALSKKKYTIEDYKNAVKTYRNAENKEQKRKMERLINDIKGNFKTTLGLSDPNKTKLRKLEGEVENLENQTFLIPETKAEKTKREKKIAKLNNEMDKLRVEIEDIEGGKIYENAFEWRFEFPEVLNDEGVFVGFDVIIGNPPYIAIQDLKKSNFLVCNYYSINYQTAGKGNFDIYLLFVEKALDLLNSSGLVDFIMPSLWIYNEYGKPLRSLIIKSKYLSRFLDFGSSQVFLDATVYTACQQFSKQKKDYFQYLKIESYKFQVLQFKEWSRILFAQLNENNWSLGEENILKIKRKIESNSKSLGEIAQIFVGIQTSADNIYHLRKISSGIYYSKILDREVEIEDSIMKPLISGTEAKRYKIPNTDKYLLHVYQTINDFTLLNLDILKSNYPKAFEYLKTNESILRSRENNKMNTDLWYGYNYPKNLDKQTLSKIGIAQTVSDLQCFLDEDGKFFLNNVRVNGIKPINENEVNIKYLLGILNSKLANFYFKLIGKPKDNGFFEANKQFISPIPIRIADEEYQKNIESLVNQILNAKKSDPNADTTALETEIDQMVYQLYNLTAEEIEIIESSR
ncbi:DUF7149 domain-containing protein [Cuspidothrix issatschenkoi]|uniref:site-specific DNA-methyltransferase (adenine-specific) n=1 Tax=Cuspidothrix issatschenkoi CHARLIE-1 TaxID=2052836 RepID=A0A2S6CUW6_9CYAN|nr:Eco57I restriction-modification methylase domain-containing protein [Cuspidothrix issatschenkoi]PPJ63492.1 restriction endonuclease [Cuspidothrix issatschenkoi CHARLIE-1]